MYGPPVDPRQKYAPVEVFDTPEAYVACFAIGLVLSLIAWRSRGPVGLRAGLFVVGQTILLTAPLTVFLDSYVYGSFPTVDKAGSMAMYIEGVHIRMMAHPVDALHDPAAHLIGVQVGHLWVTSLMDTLLSTIGAFNIQALLYPALGWWCAWWFLHELTGHPRASIVMSFPYGMGLHIFRDLNWYTIEKAAIFWLPLFAVGLWRWWKGRWVWWLVPVLVLSVWMNLYFGVINFGLLLLLSMTVMVRQPSRAPSALLLSGLCFLGVLPLLLWQWLILEAGPQVTTSRGDVWGHAALDSFTLVPLAWNRLEWHRALNVIAIVLGFLSAYRYRRDGVVRFIVFSGLVFFGLALGPTIGTVGLENPFYLFTRAVVPGFWRITEPEVFFHVTWLAIVALGAVQIQRLNWEKRTTNMLYALFVVGWILMVRTHPAYPPMTLPVGVNLEVESGTVDAAE